MSDRDRVEVDERGNVYLAGRGRWVGRTVAGRAPRQRERDERGGSGQGGRDGETLEIRNHDLTPVGWVRAGGEPATFWLVTPVDRLPEQLAELDALTTRYEGEPDDQVLSDAIAAAGALLPVAGVIRLDQSDRYLATVHRLAKLVEDAVDAESKARTGPAEPAAGPVDLATDTATDTATDAAALAAAPTIILAGTGSVLLSGGTAVTEGIERIILRGGTGAEKTEIIRIGQNYFVRVGGQLISIGARAVAALLTPVGFGGLLVGGGTLAGQLLILHYIAKKAAEGVARAALEILKKLEKELLELLVFDLAWEVARVLKRLPPFPPIPPELDDCVEDCLRKLKADLLGAVAAATATAVALQPVARALYDALVRAATRFRRCLEDCGVPLESAWACFRILLDEIDEGLIGLFLTQLFGGTATRRILLGVPLGGIPTGARNGLRGTAGKQVFKGYPRRGGFAYEEFEDDSADRPDISAEDPLGPVGPEEVRPIPTLRLDKFSCGELQLRVAWLQARLQALQAELRRLIRVVREAIADGDPTQRAFVLTQIDAYAEVRREVPGISHALRRALEAMEERPCTELSPSERRAAAALADQVEREAADGPSFRLVGDRFVEEG